MSKFSSAHLIFHLFSELEKSDLSRKEKYEQLGYARDEIEQAMEERYADLHYEHDLFIEAEENGDVSVQPCMKCLMISGDDWSQCQGKCPLSYSPHYDPVTREQFYS